MSNGHLFLIIMICVCVWPLFPLPRRTPLHVSFSYGGCAFTCAFSIFFLSKLRLHACATCAFIPTCAKTWPTPRSSHTPQPMLAPRRHTFFLSFASHSLLPPSSFLSCIGWRHGSHLCLGQRSHRRRGAPPGGRRGQGRERQCKRLRGKDTQRERENDRWNGGHADGHTPTTRPRGQRATCAMPGVRAGVLRKHHF